MLILWQLPPAKRVTLSCDDPFTLREKVHSNIPRALIRICLLRTLTVNTFYRFQQRRLTASI
jgi:hypothetical protein